MATNTTAILECPSVGVYATSLAQLGLPTDGLSVNGEILSNHWDRVGYLATLTDEQKAVFFAHILQKAFDQGYDYAMELTQGDDEDESDLI